MPNYVYLRQGDILPAVGVLQKLLNRGRAGLVPDGSFGPRTRAAVVAFQSLRRLTPDGIVGENTWPRVSAGEALPIIDCIDIFDPSLMNFEMKDLVRVGVNPLVLGGMCNGVEQAVQMILSAAGRNVFMLRFHGHGAPGIAGISFGEGGVGFGERANIDPANLAVMLPILARLRPIFGPYGCVQFMHCSTGRGPDGRTVLSSIANALNVPVSAGLRDQLGGGVNTFRFEGPTFTAVPGNRSLRSWCAGLPEFSPMTVA
ncbi:MAG: peptidoglycan-binding protein [Alphaproteobacteria bacterium]